MTTQRDLKVQDDPEQQVLDYLWEHPDFFEKHVDMLTELRVPHPSGTAISLIERQVQVLRDQNRRQRAQLHELIEIARENERLGSRLHELVTALVGAAGPGDTCAVLQEGLQKSFSADIVRLFLFNPTLGDEAPGVAAVARADAALAEFSALLIRGEPVCGRLKQAQLAFLFSEMALKVDSAALVPLGRQGALGMLAIGSYEGQRFRSGMGTRFLTQLGEVLSAVLGRQLQKAEGGGA